jgi:outer membrane protein assembly factor BamB
MTLPQTHEPDPRKPLRLWPGVVVAVLQCLGIVIALLVPRAFVIALIGGLIGGLVILLWWLFFSRAPWSERVGAIVVMVLAVLATKRIVHPSMATADGMVLYFFAIPVLTVALVVWAVASRGLASGPRRAWMVAVTVLACGVFTLVRFSGVTGYGGAEFHWRWTPTPEERLLARAVDDPLGSARGGPEAPAPVQAAPKIPETKIPEKPGNEPNVLPAAPAATNVHSDRPAMGERVPARGEWSGFRGPERNSIVRGVQIETDWSQKPPVAMWRRSIGPGWSSFAVQRNLLYTQEQRGDDEVVSSYNLATGAPVWRHLDRARFWEAAGGAGPRGTPTVSNGRVYTFGATGILNALDAGTGAVVWSRNVAADTGVEVPGWGFASSPLVVNDIVIVAASGRLAAYDLATGQPRWLGPTGGGGYSSPHLLTIDGEPQIVLLRGARTTSVAPSDGTVLWEHRWQPSVSILQPALADGGDILIAAGENLVGIGMRRIAVSHNAFGWTVEERWTSRGLKPYFNDYVVHKGHAFGFDGSILACIDLKDGKRKWKGGRYGHGQLVLLPDQDLLLVLSEEGELVLVKATTDQFTEVARFKAIEGKTWNHPVLVGDVLLVRNDQEMAAFRLSLARPPAS